jgi:hypothetical protein
MPAVTWQATLIIRGCIDSLVGVPHLRQRRAWPQDLAGHLGASDRAARARSNVTAQSLAGVVDAIVKTGDATISTISVRARPGRPLAAAAAPRPRTAAGRLRLP